MKLRRLRLEQFKRFREPLQIDGFADGLNLFAAPNESGKSTVAEALRAAFFERHRSSSVDHLRPWGDPAATPSVEVDFELNGRLHRLSKTFLGKKRCTLVIDGQPPLDGVAAEDHLAELLGFQFALKGSSGPQHQGIPGLLWITQGTSHELDKPVAHAADHLRQVLGESLGDLASSSGDAVLRAVEAQRNELLTPATGTPRGEHAAAQQRRAELAAMLDSLARDIQAYQSSVDRLAQLRREHQRDEQQRPWAALRQQHQAAVARLEAAQGLAARLSAEQATLGQWRAQTAALRSELDAFARDDAAVAARRQALQQAAAAEAGAHAEAEAWALRHREAQAADAEARQQLERVRALFTRTETTRTAADLDAQCTQLATNLARAQEERARWLQLQAEAQAGAIPKAELDRLKHLADTLRDVTVRLDAAATTLEITLHDGQQLQVGDDTVSGHSRRTVAQRTEIGIAGVGRIVVQPGGADIQALASQRDSLTAELSTLLQQLRAATPAEAEERARQAAQRQQDARASQKVLDALAPQGVDTLEAALTARRARAAELRAALGDLPAPQPGDEALPDRDGFRPDDEWQPVAVSGEYLIDEQLLVRARPRAGQPGFEVIVPLRLDDGGLVIVNRGWLPVGSAQDSPDVVPAAPAGRVDVVGRVRPSEPTLPGRGAPEGQIATIHLPTVADSLGDEVVEGAYLQLVDESPAPATRPQAALRPLIDEGPHLSYTFQWYVFALLGFIGFGWAIRQELRIQRAAETGEPVPPPKRRRSGPTDDEEEDALVDAGAR